jgi:hypothetical protein
MPCIPTVAYGFNMVCPVRLAYQPPASITFLSEQIIHQQQATGTFLSEQMSTSHSPNERGLDYVIDP